MLSIGLLGPTYAGKSTLLGALLTGKVGPHPRTVAFDIRMKHFAGTRVEFYDLSGNSRYSEITKAIKKRCDVFFLCVDAHRIRDSLDYFAELRFSCPVYVLMTKADIPVPFMTVDECLWSFPQARKLLQVSALRHRNMDKLENLILELVQPPVPTTTLRTSWCACLMSMCHGT